MTAHRHHRVPDPPGTPTARLLPAAAYDPDAFRGLIDTISCLALAISWNTTVSFPDADRPALPACSKVAG